MTEQQRARIYTYLDALDEDITDLADELAGIDAMDTPLEHHSWTSADVLFASLLSAIGGYVLAHLLSALAVGRVP